MGDQSNKLPMKMNWLKGNLRDVELLVGEDGPGLLVNELDSQFLDISSYRQLKDRRQTRRQQVRRLTFGLKQIKFKVLPIVRKFSSQRK